MITNSQHQNPFNLFFKVLLICITLFAILVLLDSCASKPVQNTHTIERIIEHRTDSVKTTQVNAAIIDSLIVQIAKVKTAKPECDSITQATLDQVLKQLNTSKKSGNNEATIHYDEFLKKLVIILKQAETKTENTATKKIDTDTSKDKEIVKVEVKYIPWWVKCFAYWGFACLLYVAWRISRIWI
ncbi:hypothetical protein ACFX5D_04070 [Flavobacterium sp. LB3P45]|uniref:Uncharacterized protein n=1 Tax=Flavobacterium fructosi TaxID=3230416 RepID=A0ABW6HJE6_9FLAO